MNANNECESAAERHACIVPSFPDSYHVVPAVITSPLLQISRDFEDCPPKWSVAMTHVKWSVKAAPIIVIGLCLIAFGAQPSQTTPTTQPTKAPVASTSQASEREQELKALVGRLMQENLNLKMQLNESLNKQFQLSEQIKALKSKAVPSGWIGHEFNGSEFYTLPVTSRESGK